MGKDSGWNCNCELSEKMESMIDQCRVYKMNCFFLRFVVWFYYIYAIMAVYFLFKYYESVRKNSESVFNIFKKMNRFFSVLDVDVANSYHCTCIFYFNFNYNYDFKFFYVFKTRRCMWLCNDSNSCM